ncbi:Root cap [Macleaya cordata]|uniref:Root cap n=1 Tax=Macleaya cordata TaxID=56857 RepID=A0A200Q6A8_MACCD|nr:Root cap [Macleaya cordata]
MARAMAHLAGASAVMILVVMIMVVVVEAAKTPPGIANNQKGQATCKNEKYKECHNLVHVCPKFCPDSCHVHCASCKPICGPGDDDTETAPTPPVVYPSPAPSVPTPTPPVDPIPPSEPTPSPPVYPTPPTEPTPTPPTTPTPPSTPPSSGVSPKKAKCRDPKYTNCYNMEHVCPTSCPGGCEVDCVTCKPVCSCDQPGHVCQDPRFIGGDGITFYFHGKKDCHFCLLSDSNLHINAHFIGRRNQNLKRDFTWVEAIGILFDDHKIYVGAQKTATWDDSVDRLSVSFDGQPIYLPESEGAKWQSELAPSVSITRSSVTNSITIEVEGIFKITANVVPITEEESRVHNYGITKDDCFAHLDLGFKFYSLSEDVNGVLGQTYGKDYVSKVKMGISMPVMGGDKKFVTSSLFANDCAVTRFTGSGASSEMAEYASLNCASGMDGRGVVCKR